MARRKEVWLVASKPPSPIYSRPAEAWGAKGRGASAQPSRKESGIGRTQPAHAES